MVDLVSRVLKLGIYLHLSDNPSSGGPEGLRSLTNPKAIVVDRWPFLVQTGIPAALDYPIRSLVHSWYEPCGQFIKYELTNPSLREFIGGIIQLMHGDTLSTRFTGLLQLLRAGRR